MLEFNIVRLDYTEWPGEKVHGLTYCDYKNFGLDLFYYRYRRDFIDYQVNLQGGVEVFEDVSQYIGKHFNTITAPGAITGIDWLDEIGSRVIQGIPVCIHIPSWKIYRFPLEVIKEIQSRGWYITLDESYEGYVDHLNLYWMWLMMSGVSDFNFIRIISGRFNGHPSCKNTDIQNIDLDLDFTGLRICSFPYFWFRSVNMYQHLKNVPINLNRPSGTLMCYNNRLRHHRLFTLAKILYDGFLDRVTWSALGTPESVKADFNALMVRLDNNPVAWADSSIIDELSSQCPKTVDSVEKNQSDLVASPDREIYENHIFNLVTETAYGVKEWDSCGVNAVPIFSPHAAHYEKVYSQHRRYGFITEKTYKPIVFGQVFLIVGGINSLTHLRSLGFETFNKFFNEQYDHQLDDSKRYEEVVNLAKNLINNDWDLTRSEIKEVLQHNKDHFFDVSVLTEKAYELVDFFRTHIT